MTPDWAIEVRRLEKSYTPGVPVLQGFDFALRRGEVHALVGSNGAGKSTLAKILTGLTPANEGEILLQGRPYQPRSKPEATEAGVVMVLQELNLIPTLTVAENLFLHRLPHRLGVVSRAKLREQAGAALRRVGLESLDPDSPAGSLGVGQQQLVEIAAALAQRSSVLILDEPTAALTGPEIERLFDQIRRLQAEGVALIYISHRMDEIGRIADAVTVMRDGRRIATHRVGQVETRQLVREMAGTELADRPLRGAAGGNAEPGLSVRDLWSGQAVRGVSFEARRGEILGIAGLIGSGRTETLRALFGAERIDAGEVRLGPSGEPFRPGSPVDAVRKGLALIPEDRKQDGLLLRQPVILNATLAALERHARWGIRQRHREEEAATAGCDRLAVKRDSLEQSVGELSGGNQQKIVIARWLLRESEVFLFDEPTRGIDVAAKETIYRLLDELAGQGKTLVVVSSDLVELMRISHRIVVLSNGRVTGEFGPEEWTQERITEAAFAGYVTKPEAA
jgi:ribose transport system ATP-binding protein